MAQREVEVVDGLLVESALIAFERKQALKRFGQISAKMLRKVCARGTPLGKVIHLHSHSVWFSQKSSISSKLFMPQSVAATDMKRTSPK